MIITIDASAAVEFVMGRPKQHEIASVLKKADQVISPSLYIYETANVLWKYKTSIDFPVNKLVDKAKYVYELIDEYVEPDDMYEEILSLACALGHPVYDASYLVTCKRKNAALLTLDSRLIKAAQKANISIILI